MSEKQDGEWYYWAAYRESNRAELNLVQRSVEMACERAFLAGWEGMAKEHRRVVGNLVQWDDNLPITDEWWAELSFAWFADLDGNEVLCFNVFEDHDKDPENRTLLVRSDDGSWGFWLQSIKANELHTPHNNSFSKLVTRGDVRRLRAALGMKDR